MVHEGSSNWAVVPDQRGSGAIEWWLIADDSEAERRGREVVKAFFGPASTRNPAGGFDAENSSERVRSVSKRMRVHFEGDRVSFLAALELMTSVRASAPDLDREARDPLGFLIRDFYLALDRGDADASDELLSRIDGTGRIGSENLRFLRVDRLALLGRWRELGALPWFTDLARARRPVRISEHLLEALWRDNFDEAGVAASPEAALSAFDTAEIAARFGALLQCIDVPSTAPGRRVTALHARLAGDGARVDRIIAGAPAEERVLLERLTGRVAAALPLPPQSALDVARDMFEGGGYDGVISIAETEQSPPLVAMAVRAAFEQNDPRLAVRVVPLVDAVAPGALPTSPGFARMVAGVRRLASDACSSWAEWLARIARQEKWSEAAEVARNLSPKWDIGELGQPSVADSAAGHLLAGSEGTNRRELRAVFDLLCQVASQVAVNPAAHRLVDAVLLVLATDENPSALVRAAFFDLLMDVLATGPSSGRYQDMLSTTESLWSTARSREAIPWVLDVLDGLASQPSPAVGARQALMSSVVRSVHDFASRLTKDERVLFGILGRECNVPVTFPPSEPALDEQSSDVWKRLNGKLIGVYSLIEGLGSRLAGRLATLCDGFEVQGNSDTVGTAALRVLAAKADYLLVDAKHAAHAATKAIDEERPRDHQLFPTGGGMSSFITRLREELEH
jgi:hypothetical protein